MIKVFIILLSSLLIFSCSAKKLQKSVSSSRIAAPSLDVVDLPPIDIKPIRFLEASCFYKTATANIEAYACLDRENFENLLYDLQIFKLRNHQLESRLESYTEYYKAVIASQNNLIQN